MPESLTGSPSLLSRFSRASANALQFPELLEIVTRGASTDLGRTAVRALYPLADRQSLLERRELVEEAGRLLEEGSLVGSVEEPLLGMPEYLEDPRSAVEGPTLVLLASVLESVAEARTRVLAADPPVPRLAELLEGVPDHGSLAGRIRAHLDARGEVRDDATPVLAGHRKRIRSLRDDLYQELRTLAEERRDELSDETIPLRNGRLVLPVKAGARSGFPGLVHGASATGKSVYMEPLSVVESNNRQQEAVAAEAAERQRILSELISEARAAAQGIAIVFGALRELDVLQALHRFAQAGSCRLPDVGDQGEVKLVGARHPLLDPLLASLREQALGSSGHQEDVVPLDLELDKARRVLVITGPNAGGKTVALKTVGLLTAAAQSGIPIPVEPGTSLPQVDSLIAVVGDEQDLLRDRSTFSARLLRLAEVWDSQAPGALVLIDELGSGTDPEEGSALSIALLEELLRTEAVAILTTHLLPLASAALERNGAACAAMNFNSETGLPTYRLIPGSPGGSEALALGARLGLPEVWLERAHELLGDEGRRLRALLSEVEELRASLAVGTAELERRLGEVEDLREELGRAREAVAEERRTQGRRLDGELERFRTEVTGKLSAEVERLKKEMEAGRRKGLGREGAKRLFESAPGFVEEVPAAPAVLEVGQQVRHRGLGWQGTVEKVSGDTVEISVSGKRLRSRPEELVAADAAPPKGATKGRVSTSVSEARAPGELELIGWRVEPALEELDSFLDRALLGSRPQVRIVHGHGSGKLREALRQHLRSHPAVSDWRQGGPREGGNGATLVTLKE